MALLEINRNPSRRELLWFGALTALFFGFVGVLICFKGDAPVAASVVWAVASVATIAFYALPPLRRPMYLGWMRAVFPIGWTVSHLVLIVVYYLLVTPIGLVMRLVGRDPMQRRFDRQAATYWVERSAADSSRYFRQF